MTTDTTHHVNESADKVVLTTKVKRGTGTRDQDEVRVKVKADDPAEAVEKLNKVLQKMHGLSTFEQVRSSRAGGDDE